MHGDVLFTISDPKIQETLKKRFEEADAFLRTIEDLSVQARETKNTAWGLVYEELKKEKKKLPGGRLYVYDFKRNQVIDIGPAPRRRPLDLDDDDVDGIIDYDFENDLNSR